MAGSTLWKVGVEQSARHGTDASVELVRVFYSHLGDSGKSSKGESGDGAEDNASKSDTRDGRASEGAASLLEGDFLSEGRERPGRG
jgi:hypothetical protein